LSEPFFLLGAERAGLVLLELVVAAHPEIAWGGVFDFALDWPESEYSDWPPLVPYWQRIALSQRARRLGLRIDPTLDFPSLVRSFLEQTSATARRPFGVALHGYYERAVRLWPEARFVYLAHAPARDAAREGAGMDLHQSEVAWRRIAARVPERRRIEVRYAALVTSPASEIARVCEFLGVSFDPGLLQAPARATAEPCAPSVAPPPSRIQRFARELAAHCPALLRG
jgi:hypothetical protein